jgi:hypothetical protein
MPTQTRAGKRLDDGWYIGLLDHAPAGCNITPEGPFASMGAAIVQVDAYCASRGIDNTVWRFTAVTESPAGKLAGLPSFVGPRLTLRLQGNPRASATNHNFT